MTAMTMNGMLIQDDDSESCLHQPFPPSRQQSAQDINNINLSVVNDAYGNDADLYLDVLRVQPNALSAQIQEAYFDRRNEIFQLLSRIDISSSRGDLANSDLEKHLQMGERKLDAIVCAVRILGDPDLRTQYDEIRSERIRLMTKLQALSNSNTGKSIEKRHRNSQNADPLLFAVGENDRRDSPSRNVLKDDKSTIMQRQPPSPLPDVVNSSGLSSANTTGYMDFFTADETKNITNYFESTVNVTNFFETTSNTYYSTKNDEDHHLSTIDRTGTHVDAKGLPNTTQTDQLKISKASKEKEAPIPFTSSHRRTLPAPAPQLQRRMISTGTYTTEGDGSTQLSKESTLYYDDDDEDGEEEETYYSMDDGDDDDDDASTIELQQQALSGNKSKRRSSTSNRQKRQSSKNNPFLSCMDDGMDRLRDEILDAIDDTANAFEQVLNAFTLQDDDINGVVGRIEKAKRQVSQTHIFFPSSTNSDSSYEDAAETEYRTTTTNKSKKSSKHSNKGKPKSTASRTNVDDLNQVSSRRAK